MIREIYALNQLKHKGYSLIEIEGSDGEVRLYTIRLKGKKSVEINEETYVINPKNRKVKGGMALYRFKKGYAIPEDENGKYVATKADSKLLNEVVANARAMGANDRTDKKQQMIIGGLGAVVGIMLGYILGGAF